MEDEDGVYYPERLFQTDEDRLKAILFLEFVKRYALILALVELSRMKEKNNGR